MEATSSNALSSLVYWRDWQKTDAGKKLFPSAQSLYWFMRSHKERLIDSGALVIFRQRLHINPDEFDRTSFDIVRASTAKQFEGVADAKPL